MNKELISVIVPVYNVEKYLKKCINSIINQTYNNLEIILIDDGSTDNSGKICDEYILLDSRVKVIHKKNGGLSSARNVGLDMASGLLIGFVDSDDYIEPSMYEELKNNMDKYNSDIVACDYFYIGYKKSRTSRLANVKELFFTNKDKFNCYNKIHGVVWNKLYKKKIFDNIRYPEGRIYEDLFIFCDIIDIANSISFISKPLYNYVYRPCSIFNDFSLKHFDAIYSINHNIEFFHNKGFFDLELNLQCKKMSRIITNLSKMKRYKIKDKDTFNKYYQELVNTNKEVKWKGSTKYVKFYKVFRKPSISILALAFKVRDKVKR